MEWTIKFTVSSDELFESIERVSGDSLAENEKTYVVAFMNNALAGVAEEDHPSRKAMVLQTASILAAQIEDGMAEGLTSRIFEQFPGLAPGDSASAQG